MTDHNSKACSECGKTVPPDSKHQICPACLMAQAFASRTIGGDDSPTQEPPPSPEEIADRFPQFEITECLGRGGMGVVYKARQKSLNRWVAIKILAPERDGDEKFAEHFSREAHTLAQLSHPNIVTVFDHGETGGLYYIVMEFIDGVNLRDLLHDGNMESAQALSIIPPVCEALQYAHDKGIVHRDIKPENLLIDRDGRVKIADFGIASLVGATGESSGTPPYMAPEQGAHTNVDHRADIYALGAVLYEMLTGERPATPLDLPSQKVQVDVRIDDIVLRALSKEPERRYRTANEFRTVVEDVTPESSENDSKRASSPVIEKRKPLDPRIHRVAGILMIVLGSFNALSSLAFLAALPFFSNFIDIAASPTALNNGQHFPALPPQFEGLVAGLPESVMLPVVPILVGSLIFTLLISALSIVGGINLIQQRSRGWAITGGIACCLTTPAYPLGLIVGLAAVILLIIDNQPDSFLSSAASEHKQGPRVSVMAIFAAIMVVLPLFALLLLVSVNA